jgi:hypothetical protein
MKLTRWKTTSFAGVLSVAALFGGAAARDNPQEAAREVHLIDAYSPRGRQIELALSAAPIEVSSKAAVYVLGPKGYQKARDGTNGFTCLIERSFSGTTQTSSAPACFDAEGSRSIMVAYLRTKNYGQRASRRQRSRTTSPRDTRMAASKYPGRVSFT